jgi:Methyltransferase domain
VRGRALLRAIFTLACSCTGLASFAQDEGTGKPPFITTPANVADRMLAIAGTGPRDLVVDLGSGDGRIVIAAAQKFGARGIGLELDPALVAISRDNARAAGVADRVEFRVADVLKADFSSATVVTAYLLPWLLARLGNTFLYELKPGSRIVTHAFSLSGWQPDRSETIVVAAPDPKAGAQTIIHLWTVPAQVRGSWHATTATGDWHLDIGQNFQEIDIAGSAEGSALQVAPARMDGARMAFAGRLAERDTRVTFIGHMIAGQLTGVAELDRAGVRRSVNLLFVR